MVRSQLRDIAFSLTAPSAATATTSLPNITASTSTEQQHHHQQQQHQQPSSSAVRATASVSADSALMQNRKAAQSKAHTSKKFPNMSRRPVNDPKVCAELVVKYLSPPFKEGKIVNKVCIMTSHQLTISISLLILPASTN